VRFLNPDSVIRSMKAQKDLNFSEKINMGSNEESIWPNNDCVYVFGIEDK